MDLYGKDRGNISLPPRLQPRNFDETKLKDVIVNTQKEFYNLKIAEIKKRIQRLEERNKKLEDNLEDIDYFMKTLEEEKGQEILNLSKYVTSQAARVDDYKKQLMTVEQSRTDDKIAHTARVININDKYTNTKLMLISQMKLLSTKTNVLEDYKVMQDVLRKKLDVQNQNLIQEREQVEESLDQIERKFKLDREKLKEDLYNCLLDLAGIFQVDVAQHMPYSISRLLSENIAINNNLLITVNSIGPKKQDCILRKEAIKGYKGRIKDAHLSTKQSTVMRKLEKSAIAILRKNGRKINFYMSDLDKPDHFKEEQYIVNLDKAALEARKCEIHVKCLEILLYCEKEKLAIAKFQNKAISDQLKKHSELLYDIRHVAMNLKLKNDIE